MTTAAIIVVASLLVMAVVGFIFGWTRGRTGLAQKVEQGNAWRERELDQLRTELEHLRQQDENTAEPDDQIDAPLASQDNDEASNTRERQLRDEQLGHLQQQLDEAGSRAEQLEASLDSARADLRSAASELDKERESRLAAAEVYRAARQQQSDQTEHPSLQEVVLGEPQGPREDYSVEAGEQAALREERITELEAELGALRDVTLERTALLESARTDAAELDSSYRAQIAGRDQAIAESQAAREETDRLLDHEREIARGLREQIETLTGRQHESIQTRAAIDEVQSEREATVLQARDEIEQLEQRYLTQIRDRASESARLRSKLEEGAAALQQLREDHTRVTEQSERLSAELDNERRTRTEGERVDARAQGIAAALQSELQERDRVVERLRETASELEQSYTEQIAQRRSTIVELEQRVAAADDKLDAALLRASEHVTEIDRLESAVQDRSRANVEVAERAHELEASVLELQTQLESAQLEMTRHAEEANAAKTTLEEQLESQVSAITALEAREVQLRTAHETKAAALRQSEERGEQLSGVHELEMKQVAALLATRDEALAEKALAAEQLEADVSQLRGDCDDHVKSREALEARMETLKAKIEANAALQEQLESAAVELEQVRAQEEHHRAAHESIAAESRRVQESSERQLRARELEVQHLSESLESREQDLQERQDSADAMQSELDQLRGDSATYTNTVAALEARTSTLEEELETARDDASRLQSTASSARTDVSAAEESHARHLRERELENERLTALLASREAELPQAGRRLERALADLDASEQRLLRRQSRVENLDAEVQRCLRVREKLLREVHDREQENRLLRQRIATEPPPADDLTVIHGIGPATADLLASMGLINYRQIAALEQRDVEWIEDRYPALRGRIRIGAWRAAAIEAHEEKFGEQID